MTSDTTAEQAELRRRGRQRLIGAVIIALLAVVFVPMVLDPEPREQRPEPTLAIPSRDANSALPATTATPPGSPAPGKTVSPQGAPASLAALPETASAALPGAAPAKAAEEPAIPAAPTTKVPEARAPEPKVAAAKPPSVPKPAAAPKLEGFAVQVGAFREEAKLTAAREKLAAARVPHYGERLASASGDLTRLRAGPFPTREAADKALAQVRKAGLEGRVVPLP